MANPPQDKQKKQKPWTQFDEENLQHEENEDRRLIRLGIDPDMDSLAIMLELKKRMAAIEGEKKERKKKREGSS